MVANVKGPKLLWPALAGVLVGCLAAPVRGDEIQYLPSGTHVVLSVKFQDVLKSKTFDELKKLMKQFTGGKEDLEAEISRDFGIPAGNIARLTMGIVFNEKQPGPGGEVGIVTTTKPVTAAQIIAGKKPHSYQKNVKYVETKVGKFTIHEQMFQVQFGEKDGDAKGEFTTGRVFCVAEANIVLISDRKPGLEQLKKVLERQAKAELSKRMQTGLNYAGFTNTGVVVLDIQGMPARERDDMFRGLARIGFKDLPADSAQVLAMKANEKGKFMASAALFCKDAASAAQAKKAIDAGLAEMKTQLSKLKDEPKAPPPFQDMIKAAREGLEAIKVSVSGNQVIATASVEPATVARSFFGLFAVRHESVEARPKAKVEGK
jgi:hypothetical protein